MALTDIAQPVQQLRHSHGDRCLAGAGVAGEAHVQAGRLGLQADPRPQLIDDQQSGDVPNALLDRHQSDEISIKFVHHRLDLALRQHLIDCQSAT